MRKTWLRWAVWGGGMVLCLTGLARPAPPSLVLPGNMAVLDCAMPDLDYRFLGSGTPGQLFFPGQPVAIRVALRKSEVPDFRIAIQEITTRDPARRLADESAYTDTAGYAPQIACSGEPVWHDFTVAFSNQPVTEMVLKDLPVPERFGTYAVILVHGARRQFLCTVARVPAPRPDGHIENVPVLGDGHFIKDDITLRAAIYGRMGIRGYRMEMAWNEREDGQLDWAEYDRQFAAARQAGCKIMVTLAGQQGWQWPFGVVQTPGAVGHKPDWDERPSRGQSDWNCAPSLYPRYGKWIEAFCRRYWMNGQGGLWGLENYNEPWEGGGISGWARDCLSYRELQRTIARAARAVDPRIKLLAASSIANTEDKFFSDGSREFDQYLDIFTDHYVPPSMCYGPLVAKAHGKTSMETETWLVNAEYQLPQAVAQFLAAGQQRISPWRPQVLFDNVPGGTDQTLIPTPVTTATAVFNFLITGKLFERMLFTDHLPWLFQFGADDDPGSVIVMFGQLVPMGGDSPKELPLAQVNGEAGGVATIPNEDGLLKFSDMAGNPLQVGSPQVTLPLGVAPVYITCLKGPREAAARLARMRIEGKRPVEILPHDFNTRLTDPGASLKVSLHNVLNRRIRGQLQVLAPEGIALASTTQSVELAAGETWLFSSPVVRGTPNDQNAYPFKFIFTSDAGRATYEEVLNVAVVPRASIKVDGDLEEWRDIPGVIIGASQDKLDATELMRRPWLALQQQDDVVAGRVRLAWDEGFLYLCAEVKDKTPELHPIRFATRNENSYFHTGASDEREPYKRFLERPRVRQADGSLKSLKELGHSFAEVPFVYAKSPEEGSPFRRDRLQFGLDVVEGWHDLTPDTDKVASGFHAVPDTDYEYSLYSCGDGQGELWRLLAPGVPRIHDVPRQPHGKFSTGAVKAANLVVKSTADGYVYECAIPKSELSQLALKAGTSFGFAFKIGNSRGAQPESGHDKAVCKLNGLTLHPYWSRSPSCGVRWTLVEPHSEPVASDPLKLIGRWDGVTAQAALEGPYEDRLQQEIPFGRRSYYLSPWRSYMDTWPGSRYLDCLGFTWNGTPKEAPAVFRAMAGAGFRQVRVEVGWGDVDFDEPDQLSPLAATNLDVVLRAARQEGLRPLLLLNGHHGMPCPRREAKVQVEADALKGSRIVTLANVAGIIPGYSGINTPAEYKNPSVLITAVDPGTGVCTLSKPLPADLKRGQTVGLITLRFQPFSGAVFADGMPNPAAQETLDGWMDYVKAVTSIGRATLASTNTRDAGFDLEVWNEYTFGSHFLSDKNYYDPPRKFKEPVRYQRHGRIREGVEIILPMTVDYVCDPANRLSGVRVISGFANQRPWDNGTEMWPGQAAISRHYYTGAELSPLAPATAQYQNIGPLDALGEPAGVPDKKDWHTVVPGSYFIPTLFTRLPERWHYAYQTEFITRDIQPFPGPWATHHRYSHPGTGRPAEVWMTEYNFGRLPWTEQLMKSRGVKESDPRLVQLMDEMAAKLMLRASVFHSHKGIQTITYYCAKDKVQSMGMIPLDFYAQLKADRYVLTSAARGKLGRQLEILGRVARLMEAGQPLAVTRPLSVEQLIEHQPRLAFKGDGTPGNPDRFNRDDFACLPFQLAANRFAVGYYVVTRDVMHVWDAGRDELDPARYDMPPQRFDLTLGNVCGAGARITAYDPRRDLDIPVEVLARDGHTVTVRLEVCDYPRFLMIEEAESGPIILNPVLAALPDGGAHLTFETSQVTVPHVTWGPLPGRTREGSASLPAGLQHETRIHKLDMGAGVRVRVERNGLVCVWPRWGHDVQGVLVWPTPGKGAVAVGTQIRWPALSAQRLASGYESKLPEGLAWEGELNRKTVRLGEGASRVDITLACRHIDVTALDELLPSLSTMDRNSIKVTRWSGMSAWEVDVKLDPIAHPGLSAVVQRFMIAPLTQGVLVLSWAGSEAAIVQHRATIEAIVKGVILK